MGDWTGKSHSMPGSLLGAFAVLSLLSAGLAGNGSARAEGVATPSPTFWVDAQASTWITRGRNLFDLEGSVRVKMASAGLTVVRHEAEPHEFLLKAHYQETRGRQLTVDSYGTEITCTIEVSRVNQEPFLNLTVQAASEYPPTGVPPYLDALYRFETNPYFFLLGDLVKGGVVSGLDQTGSLIEGLTRLGRIREPQGEGRPDATAPAMVSGEILYVAAVIQNTIRELERLKEPRAIPALAELVRHDDRRIRLAAVRALGSLAAPAGRPALERAFREDRDEQIRRAAASALATLSPSSGSP